MYKLIFHLNARKYLDRLDKSMSFRIYKALYLLCAGEKNQDTKKLEGTENYMRLRVGDYRIIYVSNDEIQILSVLKIGPRGDIYK